jgi:hypothetical protein
VRINVYAEELTTDTEVVTKTVTDEEFGTRTFYGLRVYLHSPAQLHHSTEDDDRSAITFWVPWTRVDGHDFGLVREVLRLLGERLGDAITSEEVI